MGKMGIKAKMNAAAALMLLGTVELSAQVGGPSISWTLYSAVPLSDTMMGVMAALFLIAGTWMLFRVQKQGLKMMAIALLAMGAYHVPSMAVSLEIISITTDTATVSLECGYNEVTNNHPQSKQVIITDINTEAMAGASSSLLRNGLQQCAVGMVLDSSEVCEVYVECPR